MFEYQPTLTGDIVSLRPATAEDFSALFALGGDSEVWALHPKADRYKEEVFRAYFEDCLASGGALVALSRATGTVAGWSRFSPLYAGPGEIEIGWTFLGRDYWGGPFNAEMKRLMLTHAFRFVDRVIFRIGPDNFRSRRAMEKIGGRATDRADPGAKPGETPHVIYAIEKADYLAGR